MPFGSKKTSQKPPLGASTGPGYPIQSTAPAYPVQQTATRSDQPPPYSAVAAPPQQAGYASQYAPQAGYAPIAGYPPQTGYAAPGAYVPPQAGYVPLQPGYVAAPGMAYPPGAYAYPQAGGTYAPPVPQSTVVVQGGYDPGARFDGTSRPTVPPPPPGCAPTAAQLAVAQGQNVVVTQRKGNWFDSGSDGGYTFF